MSELEAVCGGKTKVHSFPIEVVPELMTNDRIAEDVALNNQGCGTCRVREVCQPTVELIKLKARKESYNAGAKVTPGVERLREAGAI